MTKLMSSAALFDEIGMLIELTAPKNIQEKLFKALHNIEQLGSKKASSKLEVYKFLVFSKILGHSFNAPILNYTNRDF